VVRNEFILGDDEAQILNNPHVHSLVNIPQLFLESTYFSQQVNHSYGLFYRPVMLSSYAILYSVFGPNPGAFHLTQMLLHITNAIIVLLIMGTFFPVELSFLIALTFLVHPINSETVALAANLQDILFFFFGSLALLTIIKISNFKRSLVLYCLFLLFSVFSKETGALFGFISILYAYYFNKKMLPGITFATFGVFIFYFIFRFSIAKVGFGQIAIAPIAHASMAIRLLNIPAIIAKYMYEFIFPLRLEYAQVWIIKNLTMTGFYIPLLVLFLLVSILVILYKKYIIRRKKYKPIFMFFSIWFLSGLFLHLQLFPLDQTVAERWFYFPIVGLLGILATVYYTFSPKNLIVTKSILITCLAILTLFSIRTYLRTYDWHDSKTFFTHELQTNPHNFLIENYLGSIYLDEQDYKKATPLIVDSLNQYPYLGNLNSMAIIETHNRKYNDADYYFTQGLKYGSTYSAYKNYANFLLYIKKDDRKAYQLANIGIQKYPDGSELYLVRAQTEYILGDKTQALIDAKRADRTLATPLSNEVFSAILFNRKINSEKYIKY